MSVPTALYQFVVSCTALYPLAYVLAHTSTYHLVPPCTRGTGFQMLRLGRRTRSAGPARDSDSRLSHSDLCSHLHRGTGMAELAAQELKA